ncbi:MAG TPA: lysophospholipid acyltransferase family protein, partial [Flavisolibacter sp.]|nr:lysophospholipid acyltransferase family protein [Flavisolibacter sp.]
SLLPLRLLFVLTDIIYFIIYYVFGYRKNVVMQNLAIAFPEKEEAEREKIAKAFYRNFTDFFAETIKMFSASATFINKHFQGDYTIINQLNRQGKKCQVHLGHNFNWEMAYQSAVQHIEGTILGVYMPLSNKNFEKIFRKLRTKRGGHLVPANDMRNALMPFRHHAYTLLLVADQSPGKLSKAFWVRFFNKPTAFYSGPENGARLANLPVVFCYLYKIKRGHYRFVAELATEDPASMPKGELTVMYIRYLEEKIRLQPENWLWSHRRWKHEWKEEYGEVLQ